MNPWALALQGKAVQNVGGKFLTTRSCKLPGLEVQGYRCWKEGKMEIDTSQPSQGQRGCSGAGEEQGPEKISPETLSHCCHKI